jgi:hypothetical protein
MRQIAEDVMMPESTMRSALKRRGYATHKFNMISAFANRIVGAQGSPTS